MQVGEDSLWDAFYEVMIEAEGVDADQQGDGLPGDVHQVVIAQIQVLQSLQEILQGGGDDRSRGCEQKASLPILREQRKKATPYEIWALTAS